MDGLTRWAEMLKIIVIPLGVFFFFVRPTLGRSDKSGRSDNRRQASDRVGEPMNQRDGQLSLCEAGRVVFWTLVGLILDFLPAIIVMVLIFWVFLLWLGLVELVALLDFLA